MKNLSNNGQDKPATSYYSQKAEMYAALACDELPPVKKVDFHFSNPDAGWVDLTIRFDGEEVECVPLSGVWDVDPVSEIMHWIRRLITEFERPTTLYHNGEGTEILFTFEPFLDPTDAQYERYPDFYKLGIFYLFASSHTPKMIYALCRKDDFIRSVYDAVRDFEKRLRRSKTSVREWASFVYSQAVLGNCDDDDDPFCEEDYRALMLTNLRSAKIEQYLALVKQAKNMT